MDLNWLISVDDHVLEPPSLWESRLPARYRETGPRVVADDSGENWVYEGKKVPSNGLGAAAGRAKEQFSPEPIPYSEMRPGCYDPNARLEDMDRAGILGSLNFPSFPRFCGQVFWESKDKDLALLCVKAFNDWMLDEWCATAPGRFIPLILLPLWDPRAAAAEMERNAAKGAHAFAFSENPTLLGLPSIHDQDRYWDPVWSVAQDANMVVCMHQGSSSHRFQMSDDAPYLATQSWAIGSKQSGTLLDWLFGPVFVRYPGVKIALSEGGIGWMPYFLERAEQVLDKQRYWASQSDPEIENGRIKAGGALSARREDTVDLLTLDIRQTFRDHVLRLLHRGPGRPRQHQPHRRRQRHDRDRLPPLRLHLAQLDRVCPQAARQVQRRRQVQDPPRQRRTPLPLHTRHADRRRPADVNPKTSASARPDPSSGDAWSAFRFLSIEMALGEVIGTIPDILFH